MAPDFYPRPAIHVRRSLMAAEIAVTSFISDIKTRVRSIIEEQMLEDLATGDMEAMDIAARRKVNLRVWLGEKYPLGYEHRAYPALVRSLYPTADELTLPLGDPAPISAQALASLFYAMARSDKPSPLQPPLFAKSSSINVFRMAILFITSQATIGSIKPSDIPKYIEACIAAMLEEHRVYYVPWSPPVTSNAVGRPRRKVTFEFWRKVGNQAGQKQRAIMSVIEVQENAAMADINAARDTALRDDQAPWSINSMTIQELSNVIHKIPLPEDFSKKHASLSPTKDRYIANTYDWFIDHYNGSLPIHKFALIIGHIFSRIAPNLHHPSQPALLATSKDTGSITKSVRQSPWIEDHTLKQRGVTAPLPFIVMVPTTIIALHDSQSPLWEYMRANENSLGPWAKKHGTS